MAYQSEATSSTTEVHVRPFPGPGGKWQISTAPADDPTWSTLSPIEKLRRIEPKNPGEAP